MTIHICCQVYHTLYLGLWNITISIMRTGMSDNIHDRCMMLKEQTYSTTDANEIHLLLYLALPGTLPERVAGQEK